MVFSFSLTPSVHFLVCLIYANGFLDLEILGWRMLRKAVPCKDLLWRPNGEELDFRIFCSIGNPSLSDHIYTFSTSNLHIIPGFLEMFLTSAHWFSIIMACMICLPLMNNVIWCASTNLCTNFLSLPARILQMIL